MVTARKKTSTVTEKPKARVKKPALKPVVEKVVGTKPKTEKSTAKEPVKPKSTRGGYREGSGTSKGDHSLYKPEYVQAMREFFSFDLESFETVSSDFGDKRLAKRPPTLTRFAAQIGVTKRTIYNWAHDRDEELNLTHPEFAHAYEMAKDMIETINYEGAAMKVYDANIVSFNLKVNHGWKDETFNNVAVTKTNYEELDRVYSESSAAREKREETARIEKQRLLDEASGDG